MCQDVQDRGSQEALGVDDGIEALRRSSEFLGPLSPYFPSRVLDVPGNGRQLVAVFPALMLLLGSVYWATTFRSRRLRPATAELNQI